jgi:hypothetical protein
MASILRETIIAAPADRCWDALRAFGQLHERLAKGFVTDTVMISDRDRRVTWFNGAVGTERLIGIDEQAMRLAYTVTEGPLGATHYNAVAQVIPEGAAECRFVWAIDLLPDELADRVAAMMDAGLAAITATLEGA